MDFFCDFQYLFFSEQNKFKKVDSAVTEEQAIDEQLEEKEEENNDSADVKV